MFSGADGAGTVDVLVIAGPNTATGYAQDLASETDGQVSVPGIGDKASRDKGDGQVVSMKGDVYCSVTLGEGDEIQGLARSWRRPEIPTTSLTAPTRPSR